MSISFTIAVLLLAFVATPALALMVKWVDRLVTARIQWRKGPPPYQTFADVFKLLGKETLVSPEGAGAVTFLAAPLIGAIGVAVAAAILWAAVLSPQSGFVGDIIVIVYFLTFPALAIILGGSASGNPHSALGASREMKLVISYELPFILAIAAALLLAGEVGARHGVPLLSFRLGAIIGAQQETGPLLTRSLGGFLAFLCALACMQAKLGLVPFDQAEAETELMGGAILEYSGPPLALVYITRAMMLLVMPFFIITLFWGPVASWWTVLKFLALIVVVVLVRNTKARLRIDQVMKFFWFMVTPVAALACLLSLWA